MLMRQGPLPYGEVEGAVFDFIKMAQQETEGGQKSPGVQLPKEVPLVEPAEQRRRVPRPVTPSDRTLRSRVATSESYKAESLLNFVDAYGGWSFEQAEYLSVNKVTVGKALKQQDRVQWIEAIRHEIFSLINGGTLEK
jgi:hypothetical protein